MLITHKVLLITLIVSIASACAPETPKDQRETAAAPVGAKPIAPTPASTASKKAAPLDLSQTIRFDNAAQCVFSGEVVKALDKNGSLALPDGRRLGSRYSGKETTETAVGEEIYTIHLPAGAVWNGLPVTKVISAFYMPSESDSTLSHQIEFAASTRQVQQTLARVGLKAPLDPDYQELTEAHGQSCGGAAQIETTKTGSRLVCSWGC